VCSSDLKVKVTNLITNNTSVHDSHIEAAEFYGFRPHFVWNCLIGNTKTFYKNTFKAEFVE
jgi:hypothetical protein